MFPLLLIDPLLQHAFFVDLIHCISLNDQFPGHKLHCSFLFSFLDCSVFII